MFSRLIGLFSHAQNEDKSVVTCSLHFNRRSRRRLLWQKMVSRSF